MNGDTVAWKGKVKGVEGEVCVKAITGDEFDFIINKNAKGEPNQHEMLARHVVGGICDESGKLLYDRNEVSAVNTSMSLRRLKALCGAVQEHCGMIDDKAKKDSGNSKTTTPNASGTD